MGEKKDCIFCKIIRGEIPCEKIYDGENYIAMLDISPVKKGHSLLIPKKHYKDMLDMPEKLLEEVCPLLKKISIAVMKAVSAEGINVSSNIKEAAGQYVMHTHFHIIPRFENDGLKHWGSGKYEENEIKKYSEKIREEIKKTIN